MLCNADIISQWEQIVSEVHKTDIPLQCLKKVIYKFKGGRQRTVNIHSLLRQGLDFDDIETILSKMFEEYDADIRDVDFIVDIPSVAQLVQPETDKLLKQL